MSGASCWFAFNNQFFLSLVFFEHMVLMFQYPGVLQLK
jgi:hypothetical protein